jgi:hypothetical protein
MKMIRNDFQPQPAPVYCRRTTIEGLPTAPHDAQYRATNERRPTT